MTTYCRAADLSYTFNAVNQLTAITDADESQYAAGVTCDANGNITQVLETYSTGNPPVINSSLTTDFSYDNLNRLSQHKTTRYVTAQSKNRSAAHRGRRLIAGGVARATNHSYDATGRLAKSDYTQYYAAATGLSPPVGTRERATRPPLKHMAADKVPAPAAATSLSRRRRRVRRPTSRRC